MTQKGVIVKLGPLHKDILQYGREYIQEIREDALLVAKTRWQAFTNIVKNRDPFNYRNFKAVVVLFFFYSNIILSMGPTWIGFCYRCPIIWYPPKGYHHNYDLPKGHENQAFARVKQKHGFRLYKEKLHPAIRGVLRSKMGPLRKL